MFVLRILSVLAAISIGTAPQAQSSGFDPRQPCGTILRGASDIDKLMVAAWAFGYLAAGAGDVRPVDLENNKVVLRNLITACARDEQRSLLALLGKHDPGGADDAGSAANARQLLDRFLDPGADLAALTAALAPTAADIRAVYADPLASRLEAMYAKMFVPGARIGPKPDQDSVIMVRGTTSSLKRGDAVLREFPGGYDQVRPFFAGDHPIVRFKFVRKGETTGMAFDGLVYVNGRWVLMPKPWRAME